MAWSQQLDVDRCLLPNSSLLSLSNPDAAGLLDKRSNISGWYKYWFSLSGSQLLYFQQPQSNRRGLLVGTISLFRHKLTVINTIKRRREFEITDAAGKVHVLRAASDPELYWWIQTFTVARNKIPPAKPIPNPNITSPQKENTSATVPTTQVESHLKVDHVLFVVHGIGVSSDTLANNIRTLQENYAEIMEKVFPDVDFRIEILPIHWRHALTKLDVHRKLQAVVPRDPMEHDANPLRQFMVHRIVDYVYYTHDRYRRHIMREVASQLNTQMDAFRKRRPDFAGKISIMGHSLGAALCYDLMCRKVNDDQVLLQSEGMRLNFDAANLFCVGNPLGTFLGLDPTIGMGADMHKVPFRILNIFKFHDPIATRLETYRDMAYVHVPPVVVPCWFNMGLRETTTQWLGGLWNGQKKKTSRDSITSTANGAIGSPANGKMGAAATGGEGNEQERGSPKTNGSAAAKGETVRRQSGSADGVDDVFASGLGSSSSDEDAEVVVERIDEGLRLDYALQMSSTMEEVSTSWSALKAHTEYWGNRDTMLLMVTRMVKSSFDIGEQADEEMDEEISKRIIDEDVWRKRKDGREGEHAEWANEDIPMEECVKQVVERMVEEAVATHELMRLHPDVRMRLGGIAGKSPVVSQTGIGEQGKVIKRKSSDSGVGGWASYLRNGWFGGDESGGVANVRAS